MVHGFAFLKTGPGDSPGVIEALGALESVHEAHVVAGEYDVIVELEDADVYGILETVSDTMQSIDGVVETKTYISLAS